MRLLRKHLLSCLICMFFPSITVMSVNATSKSASDFWEQEITTALAYRNHAYTAMVPNTAGIDIRKWNEELQAAVRQIALQRAADYPIWSSFIHAMLRYKEDPESATKDFGNALSYAADDPGNTWLLFVEFNRYNIADYSEKALLQLEKQMCNTGASSARIIARHLLHYGMEQKIKKEKKRAFYLFYWAHRFDKNETASLFQAIIVALPLNIPELQKSFHALFVTLSSSWNAQLSLITGLYRFIRQFILSFVFFTLIVFCIRYFPKALHKPAHVYPGIIAIGLRTTFIVSSFISLICFGCIPFFWIATFIIWRFLSKKEMVIYGISIVAVTLSPFDAILTDHFQIAQQPNGFCETLSKSLNELPPVPIDVLFNQEKKSNEKTKATVAATAANAIKRHNLEGVWAALHTGTVSVSSDQVIDNIKGITHFFEGTVDSAAFYFKKVLSYHPRNYCAQFNLSRCSVVSNDATGGIELLKKATLINPEKINTFIQTNDQYFNTDWPPMRQIMFPDYTPQEFWGNLFFPLTVDQSSQRLQWGLAFFGLPPLPSFAVFVCLALFLLWYGFNMNASRQFRYFYDCKYCGRIICRKCTTGILCQSCSNATQHPKTGMTVDLIRKRIISRSSALRNLRNAFFNLIVPGTGMMLTVQADFIKAIVLLAVSCFIYSWWFLVIGNTSLHWMNGSELVLRFSIPVIFHGYALLCFLPVTIRQSKALIMTLLSSWRD